MHVMAEWYMKGDHDQSRLSRILDVAQDLKVIYFFSLSSYFKSFEMFESYLIYICK